VDTTQRLVIALFLGSSGSSKAPPRSWVSVGRLALSSPQPINIEPTTILIRSAPRSHTLCLRRNSPQPCVPCHLPATDARHSYAFICSIQNTVAPSPQQALTLTSNSGLGTLGDVDHMDIFSRYAWNRLERWRLPRSTVPETLPTGAHEDDNCLQILPPTLCPY